jgi:hypothetical protein
MPKLYKTVQQYPVPTLILNTVLLWVSSAYAEPNSITAGSRVLELLPKLLVRFSYTPFERLLT